MGIARKSVQLPNGKKDKEAWDQIAYLRLLISSCACPSDEKQLSNSVWELRQMAVQH